MVSRALAQKIAERPLYLSWRRQGKVWWEESWVQQYGPVRQRIPGLDDHIGFANYDLRLNSLPQIQKNSQGRPYVICFPAMDKSELAEILDFAIIDFDRPWQVDDFMKTTVYAGMARLRGILDVVHYHGFEPAERTSGLDYLDSILPRQGLRKTEYRAPE